MYYVLWNRFTRGIIRHKLKKAQLWRIMSGCAVLGTIINYHHIFSQIYQLCQTMPQLCLIMTTLSPVNVYNVWFLLIKRWRKFFVFVLNFCDLRRTSAQKSQGVCFSELKIGGRAFGPFFVGRGSEVKKLASTHHTPSHKKISIPWICFVLARFIIL